MFESSLETFNTNIIGNPIRIQINAIQIRHLTLQLRNSTTLLLIPQYILLFPIQQARIIIRDLRGRVPDRVH